MADPRQPRDGRDGLRGEDGRHGRDGKSAFDLAREFAQANGQALTERDFCRPLVQRVWLDAMSSGVTAAKSAAEFLDLIRGEKGLVGDRGVPGPKGDRGPRGEIGPEGKDGEDGLSAYELAVQNGFRGTVREWLASLKGERGPQGLQGAPGGTVRGGGGSSSSSTGGTVDNATVNAAIDTNPDATRTSLELGTLATQSGTFSGTSSGTNTGDQSLAAYAPLASPTFTGSHTVSQAEFVTGVISPTQLAANTNNWAPTGFSTCRIVRLTSDAARSLTGLAGGAAGRVVTLANVGSFDLLLTSEDAASTAANRFSIRRCMILPPTATVTLWYDTADSRWRLTGERSRTTLALLAADVTNNNAVADTLQDVTGLSFAVLNGKTYRYRFVFGYTSPIATTGSRWTVSGPSASVMPYWTDAMSTSATAAHLVNGHVSAWDAAVVSTATPNLGAGVFMATVWGLITASADGTVIGRFASEVSGSAIVAKAGACYVEYECISP